MSDGTAHASSFVVKAIAFYDRFTPHFDPATSVLVQSSWVAHSFPLFACALYVLMVAYLPRLHKKAKLFTSKIGAMFLRVVMIVWNLSLVVYSLVFFIRILLGYIYIAQTDGLSFPEIVCDRACRWFVPKPALNFWVWSFAFSKYFELFDTFFLIVKNKEVIFLHSWHHTTVLIVTWHATRTSTGLGTWFFLMNSFVHTLMYFYYFLTLIRVKVPWRFLLTILQTVQMISGLAATIWWTIARLVRSTPCCCNSPEIIGASFVVIYTSYLVLFLVFIYDTYLTPKSGKKDSKPTDAGKDAAVVGSGEVQEGDSKEDVRA